MVERSRHSVLRQCGLDDGEFRSNALVIEELRGARLALVRTLQGERPSAQGLSRFPADTNAVAGSGPHVCCLRPGEWLVLDTATGAGRPQWGPEESGLPRLDWLDASDGFSVLRVSGSAAPWLLSKVGSLDFPEMAARAEATCAQTRLGGERTVVLWHGPANGGGIKFDLVVDRPVALHLFERLADAAPHALQLARTFGAWQPVDS